MRKTTKAGQTTKREAQVFYMSVLRGLLSQHEYFYHVFDKSGILDTISLDETLLQLSKV